MTEAIISLTEAVEFLRKFYPTEQYDFVSGEARSIDKDVPPETVIRLREIEPLLTITVVRNTNGMLAISNKHVSKTPHWVLPPDMAVLTIENKTLRLKLENLSLKKRIAKLESEQ